MIIDWITGMVRKHGRVTTREVVTMFGVHRGTAEKYMRIALTRGGFIRHGRCGIFRDQRAAIDFDLRRFGVARASGFTALPPLENSPALGRVMQFYGAREIHVEGIRNNGEG